MFATARDDAMVNGFAGIEIVRNPNYANGATSLFRMRMLPPYAGDFAGDTVSVTGFAPDPLDPQIQIGTLSFTSPPSVVLAGSRR